MHGQQVCKLRYPRSRHSGVTPFRNTRQTNQLSRNFGQDYLCRHELAKGTHWKYPALRWLVRRHPQTQVRLVLRFHLHHSAVLFGNRILVGMQIVWIGGTC